VPANIRLSHGIDKQLACIWHAKSGQYHDYLYGIIDGTIEVDSEK
jgi:hypothetical protein